MEDLKVNEEAESLEKQQSSVTMISCEEKNVEKMSQETKSGFTSCDVTFLDIDRLNGTCKYILNSTEKVDGEPNSIKVAREIEEFSTFYDHLNEYYNFVPIALPVKPCFLPLFTILSIRSEFENTMLDYNHPPKWYLKECDILEKTLCQRNGMIFSRFIQKIIGKEDFNKNNVVKAFLTNRELVYKSDILESIKTRIGKFLSSNLFDIPKNESIEIFVTRTQNLNLAIQKIKLIRDNLLAVTFNRINHLIKTMNICLYMDTKDSCQINPQSSKLIQSATLDLILHLRDMENHFFYLHYIPISNIIGTLFSEVCLLENRLKMNEKLSKKDFSSSDCAVMERLIFGSCNLLNRNAKAIYSEYSDLCMSEILSAYKESIKYLTECTERRLKSLKIHLEEFDMKTSKILSLFHEESPLDSEDQSQESSLNCEISI